MDAIFKVDPWCIQETGLHRDQMRYAESVMSIGNGHMGMRGSFEETYSGDHLAGNYLAGVWVPEKTEEARQFPPYTGKAADFLNTISLRIRIDKEEVDLAEEQVEMFTRTLDMKRGVLVREFTISRDDGMVNVWFERFVSAVRPELLAIRCRVSADYPCRITLLPAVTAEESDEEEPLWEFSDADEDGDISYITAVTRENAFGVPRFTVSAAMGVIPFGEVVKDRTDADENEIVRKLSFDFVPGDSVGCDKFVCVATSRDHNEGEILNSARSGITAALNEGFEPLIREHAREWGRRWEKADMVIDGDEQAQQAVRFSLFQLFSTYYGEDERLNIGANGFTGGGAVSWETEAFCLPVYMAAAGRSAAQNLLRYRWLHLAEAGQNAEALKLPGVLFPAKTFNGAECHEEQRIAAEGIHRNNAAAWAVFNYTRYTGDRTYLETYGIDVLTGIARFWMGRVHYSERKKQYMIHGVTGPNEYECNVSNNWYTNRMTAWELAYTADELEKVSGEKRAELGVTAEEIARMREISRCMYLPCDADRKIFEQQETYFDRERMTAAQVPLSDRPIARNWSRDRIFRSCLIEQADTLLGLYFLEHLTDREMLRRNFDFYEPVTVHESPLSLGVHSILAAHLGYSAQAKTLFDRMARLDLDNLGGDTADGLHLYALAGNWLAVVQGFAGMRIKDVLSFEPQLPESWQSLSFRLGYRGRLLSIEMNREGSRVIRLSGEPLEIELFGEKVLI